MKLSMRFSLLVACMIVGRALNVGYAAGTPAQSATIKVGAGNDLRAIYATPQDIAEGKRLADSSCARCHGANGISTTKGVPHLAGQRPGYLYRDLRAYQSGVRGDKAMDGAVRFLSDDALVKVAAFYAGLDPAQSSETSGAKPAPAKPDPLQAGKTAAASCGGCHGANGEGGGPNPALAGKKEDQLLQALKDYKSGKRANAMMKTFATQLNDQDAANVSAYYASLKPK